MFERILNEICLWRRTSRGFPFISVTIVPLVPGTLLSVLHQFFWTFEKCKNCRKTCNGLVNIEYKKDARCSCQIYLQTTHVYTFMMNLNILPIIIFSGWNNSLLSSIIFEKNVNLYFKNHYLYYKNSQFIFYSMLIESSKSSR